MSLRTRLTLGLIVLAAIGVVTVDIVNYTSLRTFLYDRADRQLDNAGYTVTTGVQESIAQATTQEDVLTVLVQAIPNLVGAVQGDCVQVRTERDKVIGGQCLAEYQQGVIPPDPVYPVHLSVPHSHLSTGEPVSYFTVKASRGGGQYRVRFSVEPTPANYNYFLLIATPLTGVDGTLHRLLRIELFVSGGVLLALALLGLLLVRRGLRPLEAIGQTATAIAGGDLSRRVEQTDPNTEIGRVGALLNTMLGQIEAAFQAREASVTALEASEQKLRRFVADASHELRTPVAAVRAYAELFSRGAAERPDDLERLMLGIAEASERMSQLVDELFLLAHLDEGRDLAREEVDLETLVQGAVEVARALEPDRPITVSTRSAVVSGDRTRLRQLVDNLLGNIRTHTPPGTPATVTLDHDGTIAVLTVSDSGPGIDGASLPHVFERFYRSPHAQAASLPGSGLGLAIVAALADAHGGSASVDSEPGEGTTFTIRIPLSAAEH